MVLVLRLHHGEQRRDRIEPSGRCEFRRSEVDVVEPRRVLPVLRRHFHHHVILVELGVDDRDFGLAEGAVERAVERLRRLAQPRRGHAVVGEHLLQAAVLLVGVHVLQVGKLPHVLKQDRAPVRQVVDVVGLNRVLVQRVAAAAADAQILRRLQEGGGHGQAVHLGPQPVDYVHGRGLALVAIRGALFALVCPAA